MVEERAPWEPITVLGAGAPTDLEHGAAVPVQPDAAALASLALERERLEVERQRLALDRERLELDRQRLALPAAPPAPSPVAPPTSTRLRRSPAPLARPESFPLHLVALFALAVLAGGAVVAVTRPPAAEAPPAPAAAPADVDADLRLRRIELERQRAEAARQAEAELDAARARQAREEQAERDAVAGDRDRRAEQAHQAEQAASQQAAKLRAEALALRPTLERGRPIDFIAAVARLDEIGQHRLADRAEIRSVVEPLRGRVEDLRRACLERSIVAARRIADHGYVEDALGEVDMARKLQLDFPGTFVVEVDQWERALDAKRARQRAEDSGRPAVR